MSERSWGTYTIPLACLLFTALLISLLHERYVQALVVLAPALLVLCGAAALVGVLQRRYSLRQSRHRTPTYHDVALLLDEMVAGAVPADAAFVGDAAHVMDAARAMTAARPPDEQAAIRSGLRRSGAWGPVQARVAAGRKWQRVRALNDLGWLGAVEAIGTVYRSLAADDEDVAWAAHVALAGMTDNVAYCVLLELLEDGRFPASRVAQLLDANVHPRPGPILRSRIDYSSAEAQFWIAYLLGRTADAAAFEPLLVLTSSPVADVRANAAEAIGRLGDVRAVETLLTMTRDDVWFVRLHAFRALGDLGAADAADALNAGTADANWWVRRSAVDALGRIREISA